MTKKMGNVEVHDFAPVHDYERKELNLSKKITYKQYFKHINGEAHESMLTELPWNIRDSICLYERMNVSFNAITELPSVLPLRLPHLSHLDISHNRLTDLPESFGLLFHLRTIYLSHNRLRALPKSFVHLVKLEKIDLSYNVLRQLVDDFGDMESLSKLNVSNNKLKTIPLSLGNCPTLTLLLAGGNKLDSPPQAICNEGSQATIEFLRKLYNTSNEEVFRRPATPLNEFPRVRGYQLHSSVANPQSAHVQYIQEQTHTANTPSRIKTPLLPPLGASSLDSFELRDRILGMIYGAAIGDAIGIATRWMSKDECDFYYSHENIDYSEIVQDEHRVRWRKGDWTGNFDLFMIVFDSIVAWGGVVDELDFATKLLSWSKSGFPELGDSEGVVISETIQQILTKPRFTQDPHGVAGSLLQSLTSDSSTVPNGSLVSNGRCESSCEEKCTCASGYRSILRSYSRTSVSSCDHFGTDNGAVVRTAILGVPFFHNLPEVIGNTTRICRATHADTRCLASCVMVSSLIALLLQGKFSDSVEKMIEEASEFSIQHLQNKDDIEDFRSSVSINSLKDLQADGSKQRSYTHKPMAAAVLALKSKNGFKQFIMELVHEVGDSNSNACVAGALLGCKVGYSHLPSNWINGLRKKQTTWLNAKINILLDLMGIP